MSCVTKKSRQRTMLIYAVREFSAEVIIEDLRKMPSLPAPHAQETRSISAAVVWVRWVVKPRER